MNSRSNPMRILGVAGLSALAILSALAFPAAGRAQTADGISVYTSAKFHWSVAYPADWRLDSKDDAFIRISAPEKNGVCGIHSGPSKFGTAAELTDSMLEFAAKRLKESKNLEQVTLRREKKVLRNEIEAEEVVVQIKPGGGQAHRVYAVANGNGFLIDCAASDAAWASNDTEFKKIIGSFTLSR
jgi:hypothetical protein